MSVAEKNPVENRFTYKDYFETNEDYRAEILDGQICVMSPPARYHQGISRNLLVKIGNFLEGKPYKVYAAPFGVRLFPKSDLSDDTYVEPDITVICDPAKLDDRGCNGAPDMIIEILFPSNRQNDMPVKFRNYTALGKKISPSKTSRELVRQKFGGVAGASPAEGVAQAACGWSAGGDFPPLKYTDGSSITKAVYLQAGVREYWIVDTEEKTVHVCILDGEQYRVSVYDETQTVPLSALPGCAIELKSVFAD